MNRRAFLGGAAAIAATTIIPGFNTKASAQGVTGYSRQAEEMRNAGATLPQGFVHPALASTSREDVGARIVISFDSSSSIDYSEHRMQLEVLAEVLASDDIHDAIFSPGGAESVAICVTDFASDSALRIPWVDIRRGEGYKLGLLAREVNALFRRQSGMTSHISALQTAMECLDACPWQSRRTLIDIVTDGVNNHGGGLPELHDKVNRMAVEYGGTVNAFITLTPQDRGLEQWAWQNLVTQDRYNSETLDPGFVKVVATQLSSQTPGAAVEYKDAMKLAFRRQLILETAHLRTEPVTQFAMQSRRQFLRWG